MAINPLVLCTQHDSIAEFASQETGAAFQ